MWIVVLKIHMVIQNDHCQAYMFMEMYGPAAILSAPLKYQTKAEPQSRLRIMPV